MTSSLVGDSERTLDVVVEHAPPRAPSALTSARLPNVERLRLLAMLEIVAFHTTEQRLPLLAGLGLPTFLLLNGAFNVTLAQRMGARNFLTRKWQSLVPPWLGWCGVYALMRAVESLRHGAPIDVLSPWLPLGGTYAHLWFVPFALAAGLIAARLTSTHPTPRTTALLCAGGAGAALALDLLVGMRQLLWPVQQWLFAGPALLLGPALGRVLLALPPATLRRTAALTALCALAGLALVPGFQAMASGRYALALALVAAALAFPGPSDPVSGRLTPLLFGVYLAHPLLIRAFRATHLPAPGVLLYTLGVFATALALVAVLRRSPLRRLV